MSRYRLNVNGRPREVEADPDTPLLDVLRDGLDLTGTKYGCGEGVCGTCTVLVGGEAVRSCVTPVSAVKDKPVLTIEGLAQRGRLDPVQEAFLETSAFQCGYCTPGMILETVALLKRKPSPTEAEIREGLEGHICRCGTYPRIVEAVRLAARGGRRG
jgi:aerobic-type carbon monoxide dehydrogenase small subunit (CoxS/CutS family)